MSKETEGKLVLKDFYADWCNPCKMMNPVIAELEQEFSDDLVIEKINVDSNQEKATEYGVMGIPYFVLEDSKGNQLETLQGFVPKEEMARVIKAHK